MTGPLELSIPELAARVQAGQLSALDVTERCLARIEQTDALGAFLHVSAEAARATLRRRFR